MAWEWWIFGGVLPLQEIFLILMQYSVKYIINMREIIILAVCQLAATLSCIPGFKVQTINQQQICIPIHCKQASSNGCTSCLDGFELKFGNCRVMKCLQEESLGSCQSCVQGFQINDEGLCQPLNSLRFNQRTRLAQECEVGYQRTFQGYCRLKNCQSFRDQTLKNCIRCRDGFLITPSQVCAAQNCKQFDLQVDCTKCNSGYILNEQTKVCESNLKFCVELNEFSGLCQKCAEGFELIALRSCIKHIPGCTEYDFDGCIRCQIGLDVVDHECHVRDCEVLAKKKDQCIQCQQNYQIAANKYCTPINCIDFEEKGWRCKECLGRFRLVGDVCVTKNCTYFEEENSDRCQFCQRQYVLDQGNCLLSNCENPKGQTCSQCTEGWRKDLSGECLLRDCRTYDQQTQQCTSCNPYKRLLRGFCLADNCLYRVEGQCLQCEKQYFLQSSGIFCVPYFCKNYDSETGECQQCWDNFQFNEGGFCQSKMCMKLQEMEGFVLPQCTQCDSRYEPFDRYCIPRYCTDFNAPDNVCNECEENYEVNRGKCQLKDCLKYQQDGIECAECSIGYQLQDKVCRLRNCEQKKPNAQECEVCNYGYFVFDKICLTQNCQNYDSNGDCNSCIEQYLITDENICKRSHCITDSKNRCELCQIGYFIDNAGFCVPIGCNETSADRSRCDSCAENLVKERHYCVGLDCQSFNEMFECEKCRKGFNMVENRCTIQPQGFCPIGQEFNSITFLCDDIRAQFCQFADPEDTDYCYKCQDGYFWKEGTCYTYAQCLERSYYQGCLKCRPGYEPKEGICEPITQNCDDFDPNGVCIKCETNYFLTQSRRCFFLPSLCGRLNDDGQCIGCKDIRRTLRNGICILPSPSCEGYNTDTGLCNKCSELTYFQGQFCLPNPSGCRVADRQGVCQQCLSGYIKSNKQCFSQIFNCIGYDSTGLCSTCEFSFYVNNEGGCSKIPLNCVQVNDNGECVECRRGFVKVGECIRAINFCDRYLMTGTCIECIDGYKPSTSGKLCLLA